MRIFPPFNRTIHAVPEPEAFRKYLEENIEFWNTKHSAKLVGKLNQDGFVVRTKEFNNHNRPVIRGEIVQSGNGATQLIIGIESGRSFLYSLVFIVLMSGLSALASGNYLVIFSLPVLALFAYLVLYIFHSIGLKEAKEVMSEIIAYASQNQKR